MRKISLLPCVVLVLASSRASVAWAQSDSDNARQIENAPDERGRQAAIDSQEQERVENEYRKQSELNDIVTERARRQEQERTDSPSSSGNNRIDEQSGDVHDVPFLRALRALEAQRPAARTPPPVCAAGLVPALPLHAIRGPSSPAALSCTTPALAVATNTRACDDGNAMGCFNLGSEYSRGTGVTKDDTHAAALYKKACDGGCFPACFSLAISYGNGAGVNRDDAQALFLTRRACDGGFATACVNLGLAYSLGWGNLILKDEAVAASIFARVCDHGDVAGCIQLGISYERGSGVANDFGRAAALYKKACDGGDAFGCHRLGELYRTGHGVAQDTARAATLFKHACDGGSVYGCTWLAHMYRIAANRSSDASLSQELTKRAVLLYTQGCAGRPRARDLRFSSACRVFAQSGIEGITNSTFNTPDY